MNDRPSAADGEFRVELARAAPFRLGGFELRPATREALTAAGVESLEPRVMQVLVALHAADGAVLTRDDLIARCWDGVIVGDDAINRVIGKLRRLSEADGGASFRIDTVPRVGFRLVEGSAAATAAAPGPRRRIWWWGALAASLLAAMAVGVFAWRAARPSLPAADRPAPLIAVLPFDSLDAGADGQLLAQAITVTLRDNLSRTGLRVIAQSASAQFQGAKKAEAGRALGVQYVIDGDVQRRADKLRITLRLDDARRHVTAWSATFEGPADDANQLALRAATALGATIAWPGAREILARGGEKLDPQAIALFIESSAADRRGDFVEALEKVHRLVALAPDMALAQAGLGISTADGMGVIAPADRPAALAEGRGAAARALEIDPGLGEGYVAKALLTPSVRWAEREALLLASLHADPDNETGGVFLHVQLTNAGRTEASLSVIQRTRAIDPLSTAAVGREISSLDFTGRRAEADRAMAAAKQRWPDNPSFLRVRFRMALTRGDAAAGKAILEEPGAAAVLEDPGPVQPLHSLLRAVTSHSAADVAQAGRECTGPDRLSGYQLGSCLQGLAMLGDLDDTFRLADRMFPDLRGPTPAAEESRWLANPGGTAYLFLLYHPSLAAMRADPRFLALVQRMGLADYWRTTGRWPDFCAAEPTSICASLKRARRR